jgi:hypothetical protein
LRRLDAPVLGIALIGAVSSRPGYGYGYGYGYQYGYSYGYGYGSRTGIKGAAGTDEVVDVAAAEASESEAVGTGGRATRLWRGTRRPGETDDTASDD